MEKRPLNFLVAGRVVGDLYVDTKKHPIRIVESGVAIMCGNEEVIIHTEDTLGPECDKTTSLKPLDELIERIHDDCTFAWAGGGGNSTRSAHNLKGLTPNVNVTFLTPNQTYVLVPGEKKTRDFSSYLRNNTVEGIFLNYLPISLSLVFGSQEGDNRRTKYIVRDRPSHTGEFILTDNAYKHVKRLAENADGILINSLPHPVMTPLILETAWRENQTHIKNEEYDARDIRERTHSESYEDRPLRKTVTTVLTPSAAMDRNTIIEQLVPYSSLMTNIADSITIFIGADVERATRGNTAERERLVVEIMSQLKTGILTSTGIEAKMQPYDEVTISGGEWGELTSIHDTAYHLSLKAEPLARMGERIQLVKGSTVGFGDLSAAVHGIQAMRGRAWTEGHLRETVALLNQMITKKLIIPEVFHNTEVYCHKHYNLNTRQGIGHGGE